MIKIFLILGYIVLSFSANLHFDLYKKDTNQGNRLLVIGGIHGNEPGGYFASAILAKYYTIASGNLWVIPNLNFDSIIRNKRGIYGDMNRKFNTIKRYDKDYKIISEIKSIIKDKKVDLILNLHDGYGFYRKKYRSSIFNPNAWGQTCIIDQKRIEGLDKFGNLDEIARKVNRHLNNSHLVKPFHSFGLKNTKTKFKDEQMQLSLTYYAVTHNKPAFAIETSKNINDLVQKVIYQLKSIEEFMNIMDIKYKRDFDINNYQEMKKLVYQYYSIKINDRYTFKLNNIKSLIKYVPLKRKNNSFQFTHPLGAVRQYKDIFYVYIGNKQVTKFKSDYFQYTKNIDKIKFIVDGKEKYIKIGQTINVNRSFKVKASKDLRVNIIGFHKNHIKNENNILILRKRILSKYAIDRNRQDYRIEFYQRDKFYGMIIIRFDKVK